MHHKKNINNSVDDKNLNHNKNNGIPNGSKLRKSVTNIGNKENHKDNIPSQKKKDKLIKISEYKIEQALQNKNENKYTLNNSKDIINRLKNHNSSLKSSIINKNDINNKNKIINNFHLENKENFSINKLKENEKSNYIIKSIIGKHETFGLGQRKFFYADKNKFNKNSCFFKGKNNSNNYQKNKNNEPEIISKIQNLKSFHQNKYINNQSIKKSQKNIENNVNNINQKVENKNEENKNDMDNNSKEKSGDNKSNVPNSSDEKNINQKKDEINNKENINIIQENKNNEKIEIKEEKNENKFEMDKKNIDDNEKESFKNDQEVKQKNINEENINLNKEKDRGDIKKNDDKFISSKEIIYYFDTSQINNVQIPKDYINIIYYNLLVEENYELNPKPINTYMKSQKEINEQMRSILVDWIIDVHYKFGFTDETLFMTILIIDRYCSIEQVTRIKYQCLGITALMISCKHEEINVPKVEDFIYITDNAYTKEEVFKMENDVLSKLNFELLYPSPIKFYEYLSLHFNFSKKYHMLGKYLMETFLLDLKWIKYKPSIISCACAYIVMKFFKMENYRQSYEKKFYLLDENVNTIPHSCGVKDCAQDICVFVDNINNTSLLSCQKKYTKKEFESVANLLNNNNKD